MTIFLEMVVRIFWLLWLQVKKKQNQKPKQNTTTKTHYNFNFLDITNSQETGN